MFDYSYDDLRLYNYKSENLTVKIYYNTITKIVYAYDVFGYVNEHFTDEIYF
jgi:hypothetical protein